MAYVNPGKGVNKSMLTHLYVRVRVSVSKLRYPEVAEKLQSLTGRARTEYIITALEAFGNSNDRSDRRPPLLKTSACNLSDGSDFL